LSFAGDPYGILTFRGPSIAFALRSNGDPLALADEVRAAAREVDAGIAVEHVMLAADIISGITARPRFYALVLGVFGAIAALIAVIGIYGVLSYFVARRTKEIGIRMALGAQRRNVLALVLAEGMRLAGVGVLLGTLGALATTRWLSSELYETSATDPLTFVLAAAILAGISLLATIVPARRATSIDPARTLQSE
jgi:ABC-type antimicrobial peptide transport system permease subunit